MGIQSMVKHAMVTMKNNNTSNPQTVRLWSRRVTDIAEDLERSGDTAKKERFQQLISAVAAEFEWPLFGVVRTDDIRRTNPDIYSTRRQALLEADQMLNQFKAPPQGHYDAVRKANKDDANRLGIQYSEPKGANDEQIKGINEPFGVSNVSGSARMIATSSTTKDEGQDKISDLKTRTHKSHDSSIGAMRGPRFQLEIERMLLEKRLDAFEQGSEEPFFTLTISDMESGEATLQVVFLDHTFAELADTILNKGNDSLLPDFWVKKVDHSRNNVTSSGVWWEWQDPGNKVVDILMKKEDGSAETIGIEKVSKDGEYTVALVEVNGKEYGIPIEYPRGQRLMAYIHIQQLFLDFTVAQVLGLPNGEDVSDRLFDQRRFQPMANSVYIKMHTDDGALDIVTTPSSPIASPLRDEMEGLKYSPSVESDESGEELQAHQSIRLTLYGIKPNAEIIRCAIEPGSTYGEFRNASALQYPEYEIIILEAIYGPNPYWRESVPKNLIVPTCQNLFAIAIKHPQRYTLAVIQTALSDYPLAIFDSPHSPIMTISTAIEAAQPSLVGRIKSISYCSTQGEVGNFEYQYEKAKSIELSAFPTIFYITLDESSGPFLTRNPSGSTPSSLQGPLVHCENFLQRAYEIEDCPLQIIHLLRAALHLINSLAMAVMPLLTVEETTDIPEVTLGCADGIQRILFRIGALVVWLEANPNKVVEILQDVSHLFTALCDDFPGASTIRRSYITFEELKSHDIIANNRLVITHLDHADSNPKMGIQSMVKKVINSMKNDYNPQMMQIWSHRVADIAADLERVGDTAKKLKFEQVVTATAAVFDGVDYQSWITVAGFFKRQTAIIQSEAALDEFKAPPPNRATVMEEAKQKDAKNLEKNIRDISESSTALLQEICTIIPSKRVVEEVSVAKGILIGSESLSHLQVAMDQVSAKLSNLQEMGFMDQKLMVAILNLEDPDAEALHLRCDFEGTIGELTLKAFVNANGDGETEGSEDEDEGDINLIPDVWVKKRDPAHNSVTKTGQWWEFHSELTKIRDIFPTTPGSKGSVEIVARKGDYVVALTEDNGVEKAKVLELPNSIKKKRSTIDHLQQLFANQKVARVLDLKDGTDASQKPFNKLSYKSKTNPLYIELKAFEGEATSGGSLASWNPH
ncbi:hypothetical protein M408DRAFT_331810 [Serendipita vermifera MAFF 305830]|uniref:Uncharacterized protein n=1 Tax=Serendipita vermifera MAFF 305830 TaxID=933852 RepID=A0A0C3AYF5_SERVB|nr:hypothetical protein M408DRAFT_331810 [Serendipita vermifera MAFF 305830]